MRHPPFPDVRVSARARATDFCSRSHRDSENRSRLHPALAVILPSGNRHERHGSHSARGRLRLRSSWEEMVLPRHFPESEVGRLLPQPDAAGLSRGYADSCQERPMSSLTTAPPFSAAAPVTEIIHGVSVTDPYRWLEDSGSPETRRWIEQQTQHARAYLDGLPGRDVVRKRIREFLAVETYDSLQMVGNRYIFRKRLPNQEQPCIHMREGADGPDQLLLDPSDRGTGKYTAMKPVRVSPDGRLLLYEIKEGGERTGTFALFDIEGRSTLPDVLPRGYLRGFAFAPDSRSFYYVHEPSEA